MKHIVQQFPAKRENLSASARKIGPSIAESCESSASQKESVVTVYRFVDVKLLVELTEQLNCRSVAVLSWKIAGLKERVAVSFAGTL